MILQVFQASIWDDSSSPPIIAKPPPNCPNTVLDMPHMFQLSTNGTFDSIMWGFQCCGSGQLISLPLLLTPIAVALLLTGCFSGLVHSAPGQGLDMVSVNQLVVLTPGAKLRSVVSNFPSRALASNSRSSLDLPSRPFQTPPPLTIKIYTLLQTNLAAFLWIVLGLTLNPKH